MATLTYRGKEFPVQNASDLRDVIQLLLTDLGGAVADLSSKTARDNNRDQWLQQFFNWTVGKLNNSGQQGAIPLSVASLFSMRQSAAVLPAAQTPAPAPVIPVSPHRIQPGPTATTLATALAGVTFAANSTDRAHSFTLDFTAAYPGGTNVCSIAFRTSYSSAPIVHIQQLDALAAVNPRVHSVTATEYIVECDPFPAGALYNFSVTVTHPTDPVD